MPIPSSTRVAASLGLACATLGLSLSAHAESLLGLTVTNQLVSSTAVTPARAPCP